MGQKADHRGGGKGEAAKGRANLEQIYKISGDVKWGRRLTTEAAEKERRQRGEQI